MVCETMKTLEPLSYYRFFWRDYRANRKVQRMNYIERGLYRELLDECWAEGFIVNDFTQLADICACPKQVIQDAWPSLSSCFKEVRPGILINPRMDRERTAKDEERVLKARAGALGGSAKNASVKSTNPKGTKPGSEPEDDRLTQAAAKQEPAKCHIAKHQHAQEQEKQQGAAVHNGLYTTLARYVCRELSLVGTEMTRLFSDLLASEAAQSDSAAEAIADRLVLAYRSYEAKSDPTKFVWPPKAFFAQGIWKKPRLWRERKDGTNKAEQRQQNNIEDLREIVKRRRARRVACDTNGQVVRSISERKPDPRG